MNEYFTYLLSLLREDDFKEPTTAKYPTYLQAYKKYGTNAKAPYFEDIHYLWRWIKGQP